MPRPMCVMGQYDGRKLNRFLSRVRPTEAYQTGNTVILQRDGINVGRVVDKNNYDCITDVMLWMAFNESI